MQVRIPLAHADGLSLVDLLETRLTGSIRRCRIPAGHKDLIDAQDEIDTVRGELRILLTKQPWSVESLPPWTAHKNAWRASSRPDSPGWDSADQQRIGDLREPLRTLPPPVDASGAAST